MDDYSNRLWKRVTGTVTKLGGPRQRKSRLMESDTIPTITDLHGMTTQQAYEHTKHFVHRSDGSKKLTIITGKSGQIRNEFPHWMDKLPVVHAFAELPGSGAFNIWIK